VYTRLVPAAPLFRGSKWFCGLLAAGFLAAAPAAAPSPERDGTDTVVRITAVVTDARGQLVRNLKASDFELRDDGQVQTLEAAHYSSPGTASPRPIAFLLDEFHTSAEDSALVRENLLRFVDTRMQPADVAVVVKPLDSLSSIQLTSDRDAIRRAITTFEGRKGDYTPRTVFERNYMAQAPQAVRSARAQIVTSALRAIGNTLAHHGEGRPAIILVSDGFERSRASRELPANLQTAVRIINRADATVYAFSPAAPPVQQPDAPPDPALTALRTLVMDTGGDLFSGTAAFETGFARMASDVQGHYVLTYRAAHGNDGRFHALQVGVKRQDAQVRARSGYVAPLSAVMRAALTPPAPTTMRVLRRSSLIQSWSGTTPKESGGTVMLTWSPLMLATSTRSKAASVVITAAAPDGTVLFDAAVAPAGEGRTGSAPDHASFEAPAGPIRVDMKILDGKGVVLDTDARDLIVPKPRSNGSTLYAPAVLRARSALEFRTISADATAAPVPFREFRRTDRLLIRIAAIDAAGAPAPVAATLLNRWRQPMRGIDAMESMGSRSDAVTQFDVPLAGLAPGEYTIRLSVASAEGTISEHVTFKVQG
jgi:VWFA-related protein